MSNLVPTTPLPLAIDYNDQPFQPIGAIAWSLKKRTKGRPGAVRDDQGDEVLLPLDATRKDVRKAVKNAPGQYILVAVDGDGDPIGCPNGIIEFAGDDNGGWHAREPSYDMPPQVFGMFEQILENQKASLLTCNDVVRTLTSSMVEQQRAAAELLRAAEGTIRVANGVDALERQLPAPEVDVDALATVLADELRPEEEEEEEPEDRFTRFIKSPAFGMLAGFVNGFAQPYLAVHQARMKACRHRPAQHAFVHHRRARTLHFQAYGAL